MASITFTASINIGFTPIQEQLAFHPQRTSVIVRHKLANLVSFGRRRNTIKAMRAVVQRVASASVEVYNCVYFRHKYKTLSHVLG